MATRHFLLRLNNSYPALSYRMLSDADPHGIEISLTYMLGSAALAHDSARLAMPALAWAGIGVQDVSVKRLMGMSKKDVKKAWELLGRMGDGMESFKMMRCVFGSSAIFKPPFYAMTAKRRWMF